MSREGDKGTKKKVNAAIEKLPGDLRELADLIGLEQTLKVVERFGGSYLQIAKCDAIIREIRVAEAQRLYDAGDWTIRELAHRFQVSDRTMKTWLKLEVEDEVPLPLLELMKDKS